MGGSAMTNSMIAAQLMTVREFTETAAGMAQTLVRLREIGYEVVQINSPSGNKFTAADLRKMCDSAGITVCSTHCEFDRLRDETEAVIEEHEILGCASIVVSNMTDDYPRSGDGFLRFAKDAEQVARKLKQAGIGFSYHNHSFEFQRFEGQFGLDIIFENTDANYVQAEIDTYWVQHGGCDPVKWIEKLSGRLPSIHLKDMAMRGSRQIKCEVGEGSLNWPDIIRAAQGSGVRWYIVEQDQCERDPFDSVEISFRNLKSMDIGL
jgi:sugar phosphate isomerase/epimerase